MMSLRQFSSTPETVPARTSWYLADLGKAQGKQELFTHQSPQKLKVLREHALIESAISSNRIEGVTVNQSRIGTLVFGKPALKSRDEEEVRGLPRRAAPHRTKQRPMLRNTGAKLKELAQRQTRPLALHQLSALYPQRSIRRVRAARRTNQKPARGQDNSGGASCYSASQELRPHGFGEGMPRRKSRHDPPRPLETAKSRYYRMYNPRAGCNLEKKR